MNISQFLWYEAWFFVILLEHKYFDWISRITSLINADRWKDKKKKSDSFTWLLSWILCCACFICYDITVNRYNRKCDWMATSIHRVKCQLESKLYMYSTCKQDLSTVIVCQVLKKLSYESFWNIANWQLVWFSYNLFYIFCQVLIQVAVGL